MEWVNVVRKLSDLQPWERNPRQINETQAERLKESFEDFGQVETIAIGPGDEVYNGHQRLNVLMKQHGGDYEIECRQSDRALTEKEREKLTVFLHKGAAGEWDWDILANEFEMDDLLDWGFEEGELFGFEQEPKEAPEPRVDEAEELLEKWGVESGQLWSLGDHRLICGDCTDKAVIGRMMDGEKVDAIFTDPPYGINYADVRGNFGAQEWDKGNQTELIKSALPDADNLYLCCNWRSMPDMVGVWKEEPKGCIVWDKGSRIQNLDKYAKRHEFILYFGEYGGVPTKDDDVWEIKRETRTDHPTAKPTALVVRAIKNEGMLIYDPFIGSGTTLIACEQLNRKCCGVEIEPKYVAVTLERWHEMTGEMPDLILTD